MSALCFFFFFPISVLWSFFFLQLQIKSGVHYWMMRLFIAVKWVNHEGALFFCLGREKED